MPTNRPGYAAFFVAADLHWAVMAPLGVIVERWPTREQAADAVQRLNAIAGVFEVAEGGE
jgi:hypothetical protein